MQTSQKIRAVVTKFLDLKLNLKFNKEESKGKD